MEQLHHQPLHIVHRAPPTATTSLPSLHTSHHVIPSSDLSHPTCSQPECESLDHTGQVLDMVTPDKQVRDLLTYRGTRTVGRPSPLSSTDDVLGGLTRSSGAPHRKHSASLPHGELITMDVPFSSRDVLSVDSGRGSVPFTMGDSLRSSIANTSTSHGTVHLDGHYDSLPGMFSKEAENQIMVDPSVSMPHIQNLNSLSTNLPLNHEQREQQIVTSERSLAAESPSTESSKGIERWLKGKSPFKDDNNSFTEGEVESEVSIFSSSRYFFTIKEPYNNQRLATIDLCIRSLPQLGYLNLL